jgi:hypothetical protein
MLEMNLEDCPMQGEILTEHKGSDKGIFMLGDIQRFPSYRSEGHEFSIV